MEEKGKDKSQVKELQNRSEIFSHGYGASEEIVEGILSVTKHKGETYEEFVRRASINPIGKEVKRADLEDNMDIRRLKEITDEDVKRLRKYLRAWQYLTDLT